MAYALHYYDLVLAAIAVSLALGVLVGYLTPLSIEVTTAVFGLLAVALVLHALFVRGPVDEVGDLKEEVSLEELPIVE